MFISAVLTTMPDRHGSAQRCDAVSFTSRSTVASIIRPDHLIVAHQKSPV
jgi:hypothetical protein